MIHIRIGSFLFLGLFLLPLTPAPAQQQKGRHVTVSAPERFAKPNVTETVLYAFTGGCDGATPEAGLIEDAQGDFYGTTFWGGCNSSSAVNNGTVYKLTPAGSLYTESVLFAFPACTSPGGCHRLRRCLKTHRGTCTEPPSTAEAGTAPASFSS